MATGALFPVVNQREDLADIIVNVDRKNTPFLSSAKKGADITNAGIYSFTADRYNDPSFDGILSNADVTTFDDPTKFRALLSARSIKVRRAVKVDDFVEHASNPAGIGRRKEMAKAISKALVEVSRDLEAAFCSDRDSQEQNGTAPYRTRGLFRWVDNAQQGDLPVPADYRTPTTSVNTDATPTESGVQTLLQSIYSQTGQIDAMVLLCGPSLKRTFTEFTRFASGGANAALSVRSFNQSAESKKIVSSISVYEGDFGTLRIVPSLYLRKNNSNAVAQNASGLVLDMDKCEVRFARRPRMMPLADEGGGPRSLIDAIASVACMAPQAQGKFTAGVALAA